MESFSLIGLKYAAHEYLAHKIQMNSLLTKL